MSYHSSESCFRRYETVIRQALSSYPNPVPFAPVRAITTEVARCRDAISSYRKNHWEVPDPELFSALDDPQRPISVWVDDGRVILGDKRLIKALDISTVQPSSISSASQTKHLPVGLEFSDPRHLAYIIDLIDCGVFPFAVSTDPKWHDAALQLSKDRLNIMVHIDNNRLILF